MKVNEAALPVGLCPAASLIILPVACLCLEAFFFLLGDSGWKP